MSGNHDDAKSLQVVFQRKYIFSDDENDYQHQYVSKVKIDPKTTEAVKSVAKKALQRKLEAMRGDYDRKKCNKKVTITHLIEAIKDSNAQEDVATDKFVDGVESMMTRFNSDLEKLQTIYASIMSKLPKVEAK